MAASSLSSDICSRDSCRSTLSCAAGSGMLSDVTVIAEVAVQLDGFKNIDLFSQGVYQVRVRARGRAPGHLLNGCQVRTGGFSRWEGVQHNSRP